MNKYLLDTNSIIYALNNGLKLPNAQYFVSVITEIELLSYSKLTKEEEIVIKKVLANFEQVGLIDEVKKKTIDIRKTGGLKLPDSMIVATAMVSNAVLVTSDKKLLNLNQIKTIDIQELINS